MEPACRAQVTVSARGAVRTAHWLPKPEGTAARHNDVCVSLTWFMYVYVCLTVSKDMTFEHFSAMTGKKKTSTLFAKGPRTRPTLL